MGWSMMQQRRLQLEKKILSKYFPSFHWVNQYDPENTVVEGNIITNSRNLYSLKTFVPPDYPNSMPDLVITYPFPVKGHFGKKLTEYGCSSTMHLLTPINDCPAICHYNEWSPELTVYLVIVKGRIWLEALDGHVKTGQPLDYYLPHMQERD